MEPLHSSRTSGPVDCSCDRKRHKSCSSAVRERSRADTARVHRDRKRSCGSTRLSSSQARRLPGIPGLQTAQTPQRRNKHAIAFDTTSYTTTETRRRKRTTTHHVSKYD
eukprot:463892-Rhodomonas_salina.1